MIIAVVAPSSPREFFGLMWKGIWSAACELSPFGVRLEGFETDGHDLVAQRRILGNLLENPPAALALVPGHASALDREIAQLSSLGVPVITFHADAPDSRRETYVGTAPAESGALAGELLAKLMHGRGTVASFPGSLETKHLAQRYVAFKDELKRRAPDIRESVCHLGFNGLAEAAERALTANQEVDGIYVGCSRIHLVAEIVANCGKAVPCVGFDLTDATRPFLEQGTVSALVDENVYHQGYLAVQEAYEALAGKKGDKSSWVRLPSHVLLSANAPEPGHGAAGSDAFELLVRMRTQRARRYEELLEKASARLVTMAETDSLTGLLNRSKFEEVLSARVKGQDQLSILMIGLNGFLRKNNSVGQPVSDEALKTVARLLKAQARPQDYSARIGVDEFCLLMPGAGCEQAAELRERIRSVLAKTVIAPQTLNLGISRKRRNCQPAR